MPAVLVLTLVALGAIGVPIAFALALAGVVAVWVQGQLPAQIITQRVFAGVDSFPLLAVPFFILAGALMDTGGIALRLMRFAQALVGSVKGGLAMVVVVSEIFFSGISGSTVADTSAIGAVMIPALRKGGYRPERAAAIIAAASSMGALIPPCIAMIVLGTITNLSVAALFFAGFLPAFVMALGLLIVIYIQASRGTLPKRTERPSLRLIGSTFRDAMPALAMPVIVFGGILGGVTTPTEASAIAVVYGLVVGVFVYREIKVRDLFQLVERTLILTGATMLLVGSTSLFTWLVSIEQLPTRLAAWMVAAASSPPLFLALSAAIFVVVGMVLEGLPALILLVPILLPTATTMHIDPLHFAIVAIGAVYIGLFMPPAGIGLLLSCSLANVSMAQVVRPFTPYVLVLLAALLAIMYVPEVTLIVPRLLLGR